MRAGLLPTPGDPLLFSYWLRNYERVWRREVDELCVLVNNVSEEPEVQKFFVDALQRVGAKYVITTERYEQGNAIAELLSWTDASHFVLLEDDAYVRTPGALDRHFRLLEADEADVLGSPRGSASAEIVATAARKWGATGMTASWDEGHGLWPSFLFAKKETLLGTDQHFGARIWQPGERVQGLDFVFSETVSADTFGSTAFQLHAAGARIVPIPQWRIAFAPMLGNWITQNPHWFHVGSLSSGYTLSFGPGANLDVLNDTTPAWEWARRIVWWRRFHDTFRRIELKELHNTYRVALQRLVDVTGCEDAVEKWEGYVAPWVNWNEWA